MDRRTDVTFGTVAASRVRSREDVLILRRRTIEREREGRDCKACPGRPFERWLYTRGAPEGPALLLKQLRGEEVDWDAFREAKAPSAACEKCKQAKTLDYFSDRQWERVRSNRSAICLACAPGKAGQKTLKRKLPSGLARLDCRGCKFRKLEHAFPRAQLQQDDSEAKRRCLKCLKEVESLSCSTCLSEKPISEFSSAMATMPWAAACGSCAKDAKTKLRQGRAGWFTCRTCEVFFPEAAVAPAVLELRRPTVPGRRIATARRQCGKLWIETASRGRGHLALPKVQGQVIAGRSAGKNGQASRFRFRRARLRRSELGFGAWGSAVLRFGGFVQRRAPKTGLSKGLWSTPLKETSGSARVRVQRLSKAARRPFVAVGHFIATNSRFIKVNGRFIKPRQPVDHFIARRPLYLKKLRVDGPYRAK